MSDALERLRRDAKDAFEEACRQRDADTEKVAFEVLQVLNKKRNGVGAVVEEGASAAAR